MAETKTSLSLGPLVGDGFKTVIFNFAPFLLIAIPCLIPVLIWEYQDFLNYGIEAEELPPFIFLKTLLRMLLTVLVQAAVVYGTVQYLSQNRAPIKDCLMKGFSRVLPVIGVGVLSYFIIWFSSILLIIPGIIMMCALSVVVPVAVMEKRGVGGSLSRSFELTKGNRWRIFFAIILTIFLGFIMAFCIAMVAGAIFSSDLGLWIIGQLILLFFAMLFAVITAVLYARLREQKDGINAVELAKIFD